MSLEQINRLGFGAWADNLIADLIENNGSFATVETISIEKPDGTTIRATKDKGILHFIVRGYTGQGWEIHERTLKL